MTSIFVDTDVILDLLLQRHSFYIHAAQLFTLADKGQIKINISSLSFSNLHYLLSKQYNRVESRRILSQLKTLVVVLSVDDKVISLALNSDFTDFEDAIQYFTAINNDVPMLITRNLKDYKTAAIPVLSPAAFLS